MDNQNTQTTSYPFSIKDCTLSAIATGTKAQTLIDLRDKIEIIHPSSIYFHFWGGRLRTAFEHREYHNDFSDWAHRCLHDDILAERIEVINPTEYSTMEELRNELIETLETRLDEQEAVPWAKSDQQFHFIMSRIVIFHTKYSLERPQDMVDVIPHLSNSTLFYHFIDSSRRLPEQIDDFSYWLRQFGEPYQDLITALKKIDPYLISLADLKDKLISITSEFFLNNS